MHSKILAPPLFSSRVGDTVALLDILQLRRDLQVAETEVSLVALTDVVNDEDKRHGHVRDLRSAKEVRDCDMVHEMADCLGATDGREHTSDDAIAIRRRAESREAPRFKVVRVRAVRRKAKVVPLTIHAVSSCEGAIGDAEVRALDVIDPRVAVQPKRRLVGEGVERRELAEPTLAILVAVGQQHGALALGNLIDVGGLGQVLQNCHNLQVVQAEVCLVSLDYVVNDEEKRHLVARLLRSAKQVRDGNVNIEGVVCPVIIDAAIAILRAPLRELPRIEVIRVRAVGRKAKLGPLTIQAISRLEGAIGDAAVLALNVIDPRVVAGPERRRLREGVEHLAVAALQRLRGAHRSRLQAKWPLEGKWGDAIAFCLQLP